MNKTNYIISTFPVGDFDFSNQKSDDYLLVLISQNQLDQQATETVLKNFNSERNFNKLNSFFNENEVDTIGLIKKNNASDFEKEIRLIKQKIDIEKSHFVILLDYRDPNQHVPEREVVSEECFLISPNKFIQYFENGITTGLSYHFILQALSKEDQLEQILVHQIKHPNPSIARDTDQVESAEVIIPHRGEFSDLETALRFLKQQQKAPKKISVCFDEFVTENHFKLAKEHKDTRFFVNFPSGVGPYPSRDILSRSTDEPIIIFHDSDDISTIDRVAILTDYLKNKNVDGVGSHELRVNKINRRIEAIRYPPEVTQKLKKDAKHIIFFPTTAIKKAAYLKAGGLSTVRKHSSDTQFYWRAHFFINLKNVDEFLYIRVKHENSLTTAAGTVLGSLTRERIRKQWTLDFNKIRLRNIKLLESSLLDEPSVSQFDLIPLKEDFRSDILNFQKLTLSLRERSDFAGLKKPTFPHKNDIQEDRILEYNKIDNYEIYKVKNSISWRIGWAITRVIMVLFGWIPFVKKRIE